MYSTYHVRGEHLLWLMPIVCLWLTSINAPILNFVLYYDSQFYLFNFFTTGVIFLFLIAVPFFIHHHLRTNQLRNSIIAWVHILPSVILIFSIISIYAYAPTINTGWKNDPISNPNFIKWEGYNYFAILLFKSFLLVQLLFTVYGIILIKFYLPEEDWESVNTVNSFSSEKNEIMINPAYKYTWTPNPAKPLS